MLAEAAKLRSKNMYSALVYLNCGLRDKELRKLRWRQIDLVHKKQPSVGKSKTDAGTGRAIPLNDRVMIARDAHAIVESPVKRQVVIAVLMPGHPSMRTTAKCTSSEKE